MPERGKRLWAMLLLVAALLGCRADNQTPAAEGEPAGAEPTQAVTHDGKALPYDSGAEMRPDLMRIAPTAVPAGGQVELHYPEETDRGVAFVLEERMPDGWRHRYWLTSVPQNSTATPSWAAAEEDFGWNDVGITGPGPDRILVPDTAEPGEYRVCTANAVSNFCSELVIVD